MPGLFSTIEGVDGAGKTTVAGKVANRLERAGVAVTLTMEPTDTWRGEAVKKAIERDVDPVTETFLFLADRQAHSPRIRSWRGEGTLVISDRYADSTYAYQGARLAGKVDRPMRWLQKLSAPYLVTPDVTYLLAVPPELALARIGHRAKRVRFEELGFLRRVATNYRELAQDPRFVKVDATRDAGAVSSDIVADLLRRYRQ